MYELMPFQEGTAPVGEEAPEVEGSSRRREATAHAEGYEAQAAALEPDAQPHNVLRPMLSSEVTRAEFVRQLYPISLVLVGHDGGRTMDYAASRGIVNQGGVASRPDDPVTRAEAAVMLMRFRGLGGAELEGNVYFFNDVFPGDWYFEAAHACRLNGVFLGDTQNQFLPGRTLSPDQVRLLRMRVGAAAPISKAAQATLAQVVVQPLDEPLDLRALLDRDRLTAKEITKAREMIARPPEDQRAPHYETLAGKVLYRNQRNNEGTYVTPEHMCNMTSVAMALETLGIGNPDETRQFEDYLDETRAEEGLGSRFGATGQHGIAAHLGAVADPRTYVSHLGQSDMKAFFVDDVLPALQKGASATMSIVGFGPGHIVRIQWVESGGLRVDDPYGEAAQTGHFTETANSKTEERGDAVYGEDNLWGWAFVTRQAKWVDIYNLPTT